MRERRTAHMGRMRKKSKDFRVGGGGMDRRSCEYIGRIRHGGPLYCREDLRNRPESSRVRQARDRSGAVERKKEVVRTASPTVVGIGRVRRIARNQGKAAGLALLKCLACPRGADVRGRINRDPSTLLRHPTGRRSPLMRGMWAELPTLRLRKPGRIRTTARNQGEAAGRAPARPGGLALWRG